MHQRLTSISPLLSIHRSTWIAARRTPDVRRLWANGQRQLRPHPASVDRHEAARRAPIERSSGLCTFIPATRGRSHTGTDTRNLAVCGRKDERTRARTMHPAPSVLWQRNSRACSVTENGIAIPYKIKIPSRFCHVRPRFRRLPNIVVTVVHCRLWKILLRRQILCIQIL